MNNYYKVCIALAKDCLKDNQKNSMFIPSERFYRLQHADFAKRHRLNALRFLRAHK